MSGQWKKFLTEAQESPAPAQLDLPGLGPSDSSEPADDVDDLSSQLAQMVADSEVANEELDNLMSQIYDKIADLKGLGVNTEEDPEDYRRTRMGFMDEVRAAIEEVRLMSTDLD